MGINVFLYFFVFSCNQFPFSFVYLFWKPASLKRFPSKYCVLLHSPSCAQRRTLLFILLNHLFKKSLWGKKIRAFSSIALIAMYINIPLSDDLFRSSFRTEYVALNPILCCHNNILLQLGFCTHLAFIMKL